MEKYADNQFHHEIVYFIIKMDAIEDVDGFFGLDDPNILFISLLEMHGR